MGVTLGADGVGTLGTDAGSTLGTDAGFTLGGDTIDGVSECRLVGVGLTERTRRLLIRGVDGAELDLSLGASMIVGKIGR